MTTAADLLTTIQEAGATIWAEGDRLKFRGLPARLIPLIRDHKVELLALLADYDTAEREAIQWESEQPPPESGPGISGFEDMPPLTAAQHGVIVRQCMGVTPAPAARVQHKPAAPPQAAPATVTCGSCAEFEPGPTHWARGVGRCSRTADGLPPVASRGYGVCFPDAQRVCPDYQPLED